jgi:hypothetical protein
MENREKAVIRFSGGGLLKGYLLDFSPYISEIAVEETETAEVRKIGIEDIKAVFFVKSFEGDHEYREKKAYGTTRVKGNRVIVRFNDGESMVGFLEGDFPWEHGFFLSRQDSGMKGFFLLPVDEDANNTKVFVLASSVKAVTVVP